MPISLVSPHCAPSVSNFDSVTAIGIPKTSSLHCSNSPFAPCTAITLATTGRRWRCRSPMASAKDPMDRIPKQLRDESLKEGMMDNYKSAPEFLYGLSPSQSDMFIDEHNPASRLSESGPKGSISSLGTYLKHSGKRSVSGMDDGVSSKFTVNSVLVPCPRSDRRYDGRPEPPDMASAFLLDRNILLPYPICSKVSELIVAQLLYLDSKDHSEPIYLYISSPGTEDDDKGRFGEESDAYGIADVMLTCKSKIYTVNMSTVNGQAAMLLSLGFKGRRGVMKRSCISLHLPNVVESSGLASEMWVKGEIADLHTETFLELLSKGTGKPTEELCKDLEGGRRFNAQQAIDYGLADFIVGPKEFAGHDLPEKKSAVPRRKVGLFELKPRTMKEAQN